MLSSLILASVLFAQDFSDPGFVALLRPVAAAGGFDDPSDINSSELKLWLRSDDLSGVAEGVDTVDWWTDRSGNANYITNYTVTLDKAGKSNSIVNSHAVVDFKGNDWLRRNSTDSSIQITQPSWLFLVVKVRALPGTQQTIFGGVTNNTQFGVSSGSRFLLTDGTTTDLIDGTNVDTNSWYVVSVKFNGTSSLIRTNGVDAKAGSAGTTTSILGLTAGKQASGSANSFNGHIPEVFITTRALTATEIDALEAYLGTRYGITIF